MPTPQPAIRHQKGVLNQLGFTSIDPPALVLPVLPPDRTTPTNDIILKPDVPWSKNGKPPKYLARKGARNLDREPPLPRRGLCFARRHLGAALSAFHNYALSVSRTSGVFYSDARRDSWEFNVNKDTIVAWTRTLERSGWFDRIDSGKRLKRNRTTGMFASIRYKVLDHDAWAATNPGKCRFREPVLNLSEEPVQDTSRSEITGQDESGGQSEKPRTTCPENTSPPVRTIRTKQEVSGKGKKEKKQECGDKSSPLPDATPASAPTFPSEPQIKGNGKTETEICPDCGGNIYAWAAAEGLPHDCPAKKKNRVRPAEPKVAAHA